MVSSFMSSVCNVHGSSVRLVGMMVFSMVIWMSLGHKLSHR